MNTIRIFFCSGLLAMALASAGCHTTCDGRGPSEICELHHSMMQTDTVKNRNRPPPSQEYLQARVQSFRHSYPYVLPEQCDRCVVYVCPECVRLEKEWKQQHPGER